MRKTSSYTTGIIARNLEDFSSNDPNLVAASKAHAAMIDRCQRALEPMLLCDKIMPVISADAVPIIAQIEADLQACAKNELCTRVEMHILMGKHAEAVRMHVRFPAPR